MSVLTIDTFFSHIFLNISGFNLPEKIHKKLSFIFHFGQLKNLYFPVRPNKIHITQIHCSVVFLPVHESFMNCLWFVNLFFIHALHQSNCMNKFQPRKYQLIAHFGYLFNCVVQPALTPTVWYLLYCWICKLGFERKKVPNIELWCFSDVDFQRIIISFHPVNGTIPLQAISMLFVSWTDICGLLWK